MKGKTSLSEKERPFTTKGGERTERAFLKERRNSSSLFARKGGGTQHRRKGLRFVRRRGKERNTVARKEKGGNGGKRGNGREGKSSCREGDAPIPLYLGERKGSSRRARRGKKKKGDPEERP